MYQTYFGLVEAPFSIAPDPRYLYMSQRHQEALATLLYGVSSDGGFVLLTGEVGAGKTTICRCLLEQVPGACDVAYIFNPRLTVVELLSTICDEFGIAYPQGTTSIKQFVDLINAYLLESHARGRRAVLIIDEAQNLSADVLEQMRLLTNLETHQRKLLQIILLGQPELAEMLDKPELRQLSQRIVARYHLEALNKREVAAYVKHRLEVSGAQRQLFPDALLGKLYNLSGGVPRIVNVLCDRALLGAFVQGKERVDRATLAQAAREVFSQLPQPRNIWQRALPVGMILLLGGALAVTVYQRQQADPIESTAKKTFESAVKLDEPAKPVTQTKPVAPSTDIKPDAMVPAALVLPVDVPRSRSMELAYAALFQAWGGRYREGVEPCRQAETQGLRCRMTSGGLDELRQLNVPAVLHMLDDQGQEFYATLTRLEGNTATFAFGTETRSVNFGALALQWSGDYTLLLRLPPDTYRNIRTGERGPAVEWLSKQLAQAQGRVVKTGRNPVFDADLKRQVKQFQLSHGLVPDGVVGPRTLARLSSVADQTAPRLSSDQGGE